MHRLKFPAADEWLTAALIPVLIWLGGCALPMVTTYGNQPERTGENTYTFLLYYNTDAMDVHIDDKADEIVREIERNNGHNRCQGRRRGPDPEPWDDKQIRIDVTCE